MGTGNISAATDGTIIPASHHNSLRSALIGDLVPRDSSGVADDVAGSLGSSSYPWLKLFLGAVASGLTIEENTGHMVFKLGGTERLRITANGIILSTSAGSFEMDGSDVIIKRNGDEMLKVGLDSIEIGNKGNLIAMGATGDLTFTVGGTERYRWQAASKRMYLGAQGDSDDVSIANSSGDMIVERNGTEVFKFKSGGGERLQLTSPNVQISDAITYTDNVQSATFDDVTNATVTVNSVSRPVFIGLQSDGLGSASGIVVTGVGGSGFGRCQGKILRDSTEIARFNLEQYPDGEFIIPPGTIWHIDTGGSGNHTYKLQINTETASAVSVSNCRLIGFQIA